MLPDIFVCLKSIYKSLLKKLNKYYIILVGQSNGPDRPERPPQFQNGPNQNLFLPTYLPTPTGHLTLANHHMPPHLFPLPHPTSSCHLSNPLTPTPLHLTTQPTLHTLSTHSNTRLHTRFHPAPHM